MRHEFVVLVIGQMLKLMVSICFCLCHFRSVRMCLSSFWFGSYA
jgi:hypothetical protein